jgi:hypothetical protein
VAFATAAAALYLAVCFALAAAAKLRDFAMFAVTVSEIAPRLPPRGTAAFVLVAESIIAVAVGGGLVVGSNACLAAGATLAIASAALFAGAIGMVLRRGDAVACNCFGGDEAIRPASLFGPALVTIAGLIVVSGGAWPSSFAVWIASCAAGVYLLVAQRLLPLVRSSKRMSRSR